MIRADFEVPILIKLPKIFFQNTENLKLLNH